MIAGEQVLVCPDCQVEGWTDGLDACPACGSTMLVKQLGVVSCRECGGALEPDAAGGGRRVELDAGAHDPVLSTEVADALDRVLGRSPADG